MATGKKSSKSDIAYQARRKTGLAQANKAKRIARHKKLVEKNIARSKQRVSKPRSKITRGEAVVRAMTGRQPRVVERDVQG